MTMNEVFEESLDDGFAGNLDGEGYQARIVYGAKISRDNETGEIEIFNVSRGGEMYLPISDYEKENFLDKGWRYGAYVLFLSNNRLKLDVIERSIRIEVNTTNNPAYLKSLKSKRVKVLERYNNVNNLLKSIK
tara:strand:- start:3784 stop:4182 length:399 start_codon:yes stop_codon:yes gene_type:complete